MDKFGVEQKKGLVKTASEGKNTCPTCGAELQKNTPQKVCPNCGTKPFEPEKTSNG